MGAGDITGAWDFLFIWLRFQRNVGRVLEARDLRGNALLQAEVSRGPNSNTVIYLNKKKHSS